MAKRNNQDDRLARIMAATAAERAAFNRAIRDGHIAVLPTAFGPYQVTAVTPDFWYETHPAGHAATWANQRSFAGCNDGAWADLLRQVGVARVAA